MYGPGGTNFRCVDRPIFSKKGNNGAKFPGGVGETCDQWSISGAYHSDFNVPPSGVAHVIISPSLSFMLMDSPTIAAFDAQIVQTCTESAYLRDADVCKHRVEQNKRLPSGWVASAQISSIFVRIARGWRARVSPI